MKLKKLHLSLFAFAAACCNTAAAQLFIDQATFTIQPGATVTVQGDVTSNADIQGTGKIILKGTANQNVNMGGFTIPNLEVDNAANVTLTGNARVSGDLLFTAGKILLGANNLTLGNSATVTGATSAKYVVTNGAGKLAKGAVGSTAFNFPVGSTASSYTPVSVTNSGTADEIGVRALAAAYSTGSTGTAFTKEVVNTSWDITEAVAGGSTLSITTSWNTTDELAGFDRSRAGISYYIPTAGATQGWDLLNSQTAAATGSNPYSYTRTGVTTLGTFAVGTRPVLSPLLVTPKVWLLGAYNTGTQRMNDALRTANLIPLTEPYTGLNMLTASLRGSGGGETATAAVVGSAAGAATDNTIVDWVLVQLHNAGTGAVLSQRAALLQRDGDVVETDGVSPVNMAGNAAGSYFVSVRHRNHLGVRTAAAATLAKTTNTNYDFTTAMSQAFAGAVSNNAMATITAGSRFAMWSGNANDDIIVKMTGFNATNNDYLRLLNTLGSNVTIQSNVYSKQDLNMDGSVKMTGFNATNNDYLRLLNTLGGNTVTVTQPTIQ
ncbi:MAG: hypothetical protein RL172_84 [Bacteroidota bacterium]